MKQKILFALLAVMCLVGCGSEEEDAIAITAANIAAMWDVTATNDGSGWVACDSSRVILSEDGYCMTMGRLSIVKSIHGKYQFSGNTATLRDDEGNGMAQCTFSEVRQNTARATFACPGNTTIELRMRRNRTLPLMYKEPIKFLQGRWVLVESRDYIRDNIVQEEGAVEFNGNVMSIQIGKESHASTFRRINNYYIITSDENYIIKSVSPDEIAIDNRAMIHTFRRE